MPQLIATIALALALGGAPAAPVITASPVTLARLDITISTTSDWTSVQIQPGRLLAQREVSRDPGISVNSFASGWVAKAPGGTARSFTIRAVFEEPTGAAAIVTTVEKGFLGATSALITNTSQTPFVSARVLNALTSATPGVKSFIQRVTRTHAQFFGSSGPSLRPADPNRLVLAAYYGWFGPNSYGDPKLSDRPLDPNGGILELSTQARAAGIDGFVASFQGEAASGQTLDEVLAAAEKTHGVATAYVETLVANATADTTKPANPYIVYTWLRAILKRTQSPAFLRSGGIPVVFVYQMNAVSVDAWHKIIAALQADGLSVRLVGDAPFSDYSSVEWGVHNYNPNFSSPSDLALKERSAMAEARLLSRPEEAQPHLYAATVSPGYDDHHLRGTANPIVDRADGARYADTWNAAIAAQPDWVFVSTWNEWFEGTAVQPSQTYGDLAIRQTVTEAALFKTGNG